MKTTTLEWDRKIADRIETWPATSRVRTRHCPIGRGTARTLRNVDRNRAKRDAERVRHELPPDHPAMTPFYGSYVRVGVVNHDCHNVRQPALNSIPLHLQLLEARRLHGTELKGGVTGTIQRANGGERRRKIAFVVITAAGERILVRNDLMPGVVVGDCHVVRS